MGKEQEEEDQSSPPPPSEADINLKTDVLRKLYSFGNNTHVSPAATIAVGNAYPQAALPKTAPLLRNGVFTSTETLPLRDSCVWVHIDPSRYSSRDVKATQKQERVWGLAYVSGRHIAVANPVTCEVGFLQLPPSSREIMGITVSPFREVISVCTRAKADLHVGQITVLHVNTGASKTLTYPMVDGCFTLSAFSSDGNYLAAYGGHGEDLVIALWKWRRNKLIASTSCPVPLTRIRFRPVSVPVGRSTDIDERENEQQMWPSAGMDSDLALDKIAISATGMHFFRLWRPTVEGYFHSKPLLSSQKAELEMFMDHCWLTAAWSHQGGKRVKQNPPAYEMLKFFGFSEGYTAGNITGGGASEGATFATGTRVVGLVKRGVVYVLYCHANDEATGMNGPYELLQHVQLTVPSALLTLGLYWTGHHYASAENQASRGSNLEGSTASMRGAKIHDPLIGQSADIAPISTVLAATPKGFIVGGEHGYVGIFEAVENEDELGMGEEEEEEKSLERYEQYRVFRSTQGPGELNDYRQLRLTDITGHEVNEVAGDMGNDTSLEISQDVPTTGAGSTSSEDATLISNVQPSPAADILITTSRGGGLRIMSLTRLDEEFTGRDISVPIAGRGVHRDAIDYVCVCVCQPYLVTISKKECCLRVWDYVKKQCETCHYFPEPPVAMHANPEGTLVAIGSPSGLSIWNVLSHTLSQWRLRGMRDVQNVRFSNSGALLAVVSGLDIYIIDVYTFDDVDCLRGHIGTVRAIYFGENDRILCTSGEDGATYVWNLDTGKRIESCSHVLKPAIFSDAQIVTEQLVNATSEQGQRGQNQRRMSLDSTLATMAKTVPFSAGYSRAGTSKQLVNEIASRSSGSDERGQVSRSRNNKRIADIIGNGYLYNTANNVCGFLQWADGHEITCMRIEPNPKLDCLRLKQKVSGKDTGSSEDTTTEWRAFTDVVPTSLLIDVKREFIFVGMSTGCIRVYVFYPEPHYNSVFRQDKSSEGTHSKTRKAKSAVSELSVGTEHKYSPLKYFDNELYDGSYGEAAFIEIPVHAGAILGLAQTRDGNNLFSVAEDGSIYVLAVCRGVGASLLNDTAQTTQHHASSSKQLTKTTLNALVPPTVNIPGWSVPKLSNYNYSVTLVDRAGLMVVFQRLSSVESEIEEVKSMMEQQLKRREREMGEKAASMMDQTETTLEKERKKYEQLREQFDKYVRESMEKKEKSEADAAKAVQSIENEYEQKLTMEMERFDQLEDDFERYKKKAAGLLDELQNEAENSLTALVEEKEKTKADLESRVKHLEKKKGEEAEANEERLRTSEEDYEKEISLLKERHRKILDEERSLASQQESKLEFLKKTNREFKKATETGDYLVRSKQNECDRLRKEIEQLKKVIDTRDEKNKELNTALKEKEDQIASLQNDIRVLKSFKYVLQHRVEGMQIEREPMAEQVEKLSNQLNTMFDELQRHQKDSRRGEMVRQADSLKLKGQEVEIRKLREQLKTKDDKFQEMLRELEICVKQSGTEGEAVDKGIAQGAKAMYAKYVLGDWKAYAKLKQTDKAQSSKIEAKAKTLENAGTATNVAKAGGAGKLTSSQKERRESKQKRTSSSGGRRKSAVEMTAETTGGTDEDQIVQGPRILDTSISYSEHQESVTELVRQREYVKKGASALARQLRTTVDINQRNRVAAMHENTNLIQECNELREMQRKQQRELTNLRNQIALLSKHADPAVANQVLQTVGLSGSRHKSRVETSKSRRSSNLPATQQNSRRQLGSESQLETTISPQKADSFLGESKSLESSRFATASNLFKSKKSSERTLRVDTLGRNHPLFQKTQDQVETLYGGGPDHSQSDPDATSYIPSMADLGQQTSDSEAELQKLVELQRQEIHRLKQELRQTQHG